GARQHRRHLIEIHQSTVARRYVSTSAAFRSGGNTGLSPIVSAVIDLRSDTKTKPSQGMREAMASAEVGDEQAREDPTVLELERRVAQLLGHEEAVYLPTAMMANEIA